MSDVVNRGEYPNDPSADTIYEAFQKVNEEFDKVDGDLDDKVNKVPGKGLSTDDFEADGDYADLRAQGTTKDDVGLSDVENYDVASKAEAETGTASNKYMTPERTTDHFEKRVTYGTSEPTGGDDGDIYFQYDD